VWLDRSVGDCVVGWLLKNVFSSSDTSGKCNRSEVEALHVCIVWWKADAAINTHKRSPESTTEAVLRISVLVIFYVNSYASCTYSTNVIHDIVCCLPGLFVPLREPTFQPRRYQNTGFCIYIFKNFPELTLLDPTARCSTPSHTHSQHSLWHCIVLKFFWSDRYYPLKPLELPSPSNLARGL